MGLNWNSINAMWFGLLIKCARLTAHGKMIILQAIMGTQVAKLSLLQSRIHIRAEAFLRATVIVVVRRETCDTGPLLVVVSPSVISILVCFLHKKKTRIITWIYAKGMNMLNGSTGRQWRWRDYCRQLTSAFQRVASEQARTGTASFFPLIPTEILITRHSQVGRSQGNLQIKWQVSACLH